MATPTSAKLVLCFGHYVPLLMTRQRLLEREGYTFVAATSQAEFRARVSRGGVDLVLLCQTLTDEENREAMEFLTEHAPAAGCVALRSNLTKEVPLGNVSVVDVNHGPVHLLQAVTRLTPLRSPDTGSVGAGRR